MKKTTFPIIFILLISLCSMPIPFQGGEVLQSGVSIIDIESPDVFLKIETIPQQIKSGRNVVLMFEMRNKNNFDLKNIKVMAYDMCLFQGDSSIDIGTLKADRTNTWTWKWSSEEIEMDRDCVIKFRTEYEASNSIFQDLVVLSEGEYIQREIAGTLNSIPIQSSFPNSPLQINLRFSEQQPFIDDGEYNMYIEYYNTGSGYITIDAGSIGITFPKNTKGVSCSGYTGGGVTPPSSPPPSPTSGCCEWRWYPFGEDDGRCEYRGQLSCGLTLIRGSQGTWYGPSTNMICCVSGPNKNYCSDPDLCEEALPKPEEEKEKGVEADLLLEKDMTFINKKGTPTTCTFTALAKDFLDIRTLKIDVEYVYKIDNSLTIKVKQ